jgi:hypothetical protein
MYDVAERRQYLGVPQNAPSRRVHALRKPVQLSEEDTPLEAE